MTDTKPTLSHFPDHTTSFHEREGQCTRCHALHHVFINRNGRSLCLGCDTECHPKEPHEQA